MTIHQLVFIEVMKLQKKNCLIIKQLREIIMLELTKRFFFGFAEHQDNCSCGLGHNLTLQRKVISKYQVIELELLIWIFLFWLEELLLTISVGMSHIIHQIYQIRNQCWDILFRKLQGNCHLLKNHIISKM